MGKNELKLCTLMGNILDLFSVISKLWCAFRVTLAHHLKLSKLFFFFKEMPAAI